MRVGAGIVLRCNLVVVGAKSRWAVGRALDADGDIVAPTIVEGQQTVQDYVRKRIARADQCKVVCWASHARSAQTADDDI